MKYIASRITSLNSGKISKVAYSINFSTKLWESTPETLFKLLLHKPAVFKQFFKPLSTNSLRVFVHCLIILLKLELYLLSGNLQMLHLFTRKIRRNQLLTTDQYPYFRSSAKSWCGAFAIVSMIMSMSWLIKHNTDFFTVAHVLHNS